MLYNKEAITCFIDDHAQEMIRDIIDLINIPSVSSDVAKVSEALQLALNKGRKMGFAASSLLDDRVGLIELGDGDETVGILAHLDVVEVGEDWTTPPFDGQVLDGRIWGRGSVDDKGPLVAALYAMYAVKSMNLPIYKKVQLIMGTQEEVAWTDMDDYVKQYTLPDYGFTPDGEFPLTNIELGSCDILLSFAKDSGSEGDYNIVSINAGDVSNSIPSKAVAVLKGDYAYLEHFLTEYLRNSPGEKIVLGLENGDITVTASGLAVHSSTPEKGINAIMMLCRFLKQLSLCENGASCLVSFIAERFVNDLYGHSLGLYSAKEYMNGEYVHMNVFSPTVIRTEEDRITINFNIRNSFGTGRGDIEKAYGNLAGLYKYQIADIDYYEPLYVSKEKPYIKIMGQVYSDITGLDSTPTISLGTSYAKAIPNIVSWGTVFPGEEEFYHMPDERVSIESLVKSVKIYAMALAEMVFSSESYKG